MKRHSYFIIVILFLFAFLKSQKLNVKDKYLLFVDAKSKDTKIIVNDSLVYTGGFKNPTLLRKSDYPESLEFYNYHLQANQNNYFVHFGAGVVLEYENDTIKRIDNSFLHKNQYFASPFVYKSNIYLFGGYGLFTDKNIITQYDFKTKEWFEIMPESEVIPKSGSSFSSILIGNDFYFFGGEHKIKSGNENKYITPNELWKFNLKTKSWENLGKVKLDYVKGNAIIYNKNTFNDNGKIYIIDNEYSAIVDIKNNNVSYYRSPVPILAKELVYNPKTKTIDYLATNDADQKIVFSSYKMDDFFKSPFKEETFYEGSNWPRNILVAILFFTGLLTLWYFSKKRRAKDYNQILYKAEENQWYYGKELINDFETIEKAILKYLVLNMKKYTPINNLNSIIEEEIKTDNLSAVLRKRENMIHQLRYKISIIVNSNYSDIILEQKSTLDKRIKEIKLNTKYFIIE